MVLDLSDNLLDWIALHHKRNLIYGRNQEKERSFLVNHYTCESDLPGQNAGAF